MDFSAIPVAKALGIYQTQTRIAELNKKANIKSVQGQIDRVKISLKARQLTQLKTISKAINKQTMVQEMEVDRIVE
tara:strand:+ start:586 stop:813 length:228 start_codon:yes stop_codon:yes gene_type:complete